MFESISNGIKSVFNGTSSLINFFSIIANNILGLAIGALVGVFIILLIWLIIKHRPNFILMLLIVIACSAVGVFVNHKFFKKEDIEILKPQEQIDNINKNINGNWDNLNGGFDYEEIAKTKNDVNCPTIEDQIVELKCYDFGSYFCFSYKNENVYENIIFYKSKNGLILDGVINMTADVPGTSGILFWTKIDFNSFKWFDGRNEEPHYFKEESYIKHNYDNLVSISRGTADFLKYSLGFRANSKELNPTVMKIASEFTARNATDKFISFNNIEMIGKSQEGFVKINTFYNYLYDNLKSENYGVNKYIDAEDLFCAPIPEAERKNYPIKAEDKEQYNEKEFYGVYNCRIAFKCFYVKGNKVISSSVENQKYIDTLNKDDKTKNIVNVESIDKKGYNLTSAKISLTNTNNSNLSNLDLVASPVIVNISATNIEYEKRIKIETIEDLNKKYTVLLPENQTFTYSIESAELIFEGYSGNFKTTQNATQNINFNYTYQNGLINYTIKIFPTSGSEWDGVDLSRYPVTIVLSNENLTYKYIFNDNYALSSHYSLQGLTNLIQKGTYTYTVLSDQLIFATTTGELTVSNTSTSSQFAFALDTSIQPKYFIMLLTPDEYQYKPYQIALSIADERFEHYYYGLLKDEFNLSNYIYKNDIDTCLYASVRIIDENNNILTSDEYIQFPPLFNYFNTIKFVREDFKFEDNKTYTIQMNIKFMNNGVFEEKVVSVNAQPFTYHEDCIINENGKKFYKTIYISITTNIQDYSKYVD